MISNNLNRITINQGKGTIKDNDTEFNSPSKQMSAKKQTLTIPAADIMQSPSKKILKKASTDSCKQSTSKSDLPIRESEELRKVRYIMKDHLQDLMLIGKNAINVNEANNFQVSMKSLEETQFIGTYIENYLQLYRHYHKIIVKRQKGDEIQVAFNYRQSKKIIFADPEYNQQFKSRKGRKLIQLQSQNQTIKKELYKSKESIKDLEKRLLLIIQQFRQRKLTYLRQIEKLTSIIQTSIKDIPNLIIPQQILKSKKIYSDNLIVSEKEVKTKPDDGNYNLFLRDYTSQRDNETEKIVRLKEKIQNRINNQEKGSINRFKSQGKVR